MFVKVMAVPAMRRWPMVEKEYSVGFFQEGGADQWMWFS
jgi:hypothetical protein